MSCGCNNSPCNCQPRPSICCAPTTESVEYTFENANLAGIGVFDNDTDNLVQFRGIVSDSASLTVTLNATDNTIVLDFDDAALVADIPDATTTQRGILETATNAEALAKAATDKILTPSNLAAIGGTDIFAGLLELATNAETITGTSTTLATTPAGVAAAAALYKTVTFADSVARAAATPTFDGQFGAQNDTEQGFVSGSTAAGDWNGLFTFGAANIQTAATTINLNSVQMTFSSGEIVVGPTATLIVDAGTLEIDNAGLLDFVDGRIAIAGAPLANSVLLATSNTGDLVEQEISNFLSINNVQTGYTPFANPATLRTCDTATVTLPQLAQIVGTLIEDLKVLFVPAT